MSVQNAYVVTGTLTNSQTVTLDEALPLESAKVRLVVEPLTVPSRPTHQQVLEQIWERQRLRGHQPPTRAEVDADLQAERDSWGD